MRRILIVTALLASTCTGAGAAEPAKALPLTPTTWIASAPASEAQTTTEAPKTKAQPSIKKQRMEQLPGVGAYMGDDKLTRGNVVRVSGDGTELVTVSNKFPNLISTPFEHAKVIELEKSPFSSKPIGSNVFLITNATEPFTLYITGQNPDDQVISLTMIPRNIPSQTLSLQLDATQGKKRDAKVNSYEKQLMELLRTVASGKTPEGFSAAAMPNAVAQERRNGLTIIPMKRYSGAYLDIYQYQVENNQEPVELSESTFYQKGVRAVSIFPNLILKKGNNTSVYVVADKSLLDGENNGRN